MRTGDGRPLPPKLKQEIVREHARLMLVDQQLKELEATSMAEVKAAAPGSAEAKIKQLIELKGLGPVSSQGFVNEVFYRSFANRRQVGACFGLTGTPFNSGNSERDQGISKAGNRRRARSLSSSPGYGSDINPTASSAAGSVHASAIRRDASGGSLLSRWRAS